ncbi:MAG TPA: hypothetical protein DCR48_02550, partial [Flavobacteriales bacterium]|nr:hypothetical protein [Flavobacteriales bacterium]
EAYYYYRSLCRLSLQNCDGSEIILDLDTALSINPNSYEITYLHGFLKWRTGGLDEALQSFMKALDLSQNINKKAAATEMLAQILFSKRRFKEIIYFIDRLPEDVKNSEMLYLSGAASQELKDYDRAEKDFHRSLNQDPINPCVNIRLAYVLYDKMQFQSSLDYINIALMNHKNSSKQIIKNNHNAFQKLCLILKSSCELYLKEKQRALVTFQEFQSIDDGSSVTNYENLLKAHIIYEIDPLKGSIFMDSLKINFDTNSRSIALGYIYKNSYHLNMRQFLLTNNEFFKHKGRKDSVFIENTIYRITESTDGRKFFLPSLGVNTRFSCGRDIQFSRLNIFDNLNIQHNQVTYGRQ